MNSKQFQDRSHYDQLRFTFVGMLFALTIGEIALGFAKLVEAGVSISHPAVVHLILAIVIVVTSWIGWTRSKAPGNIQEVKRVYSLEFVVLVVDIFLVICYFIIVRGAEIPKNGVEATAENETRWMIIVFAGYLFWDFWTKAVIGLDSNQSFWRRLSAKNTRVKLTITFVCLILTVIIRVIRNCVTALPHGVVLVDIMLIVVVALFRLLKQLFGYQNNSSSAS